MGYKTTSEMSSIWKISARRIAKLCKEGRIEGVLLKGKTYDTSKTEELLKVYEEAERQEDALIEEVGNKFKDL